MEVKVSKKCGRCSREVEATMSLDQAQAVESWSKECDEEARKLEVELMEVIAKYDAEKLPAVTLVIPGEGHVVDIRVLKDLCQGTRSCSKRVDTLVKVLFLENPKPAKKKAEVPPPEVD